MKDVNCAYCMQGELAAKFAYPICKMDTGFLYVFKEQSHPGRCIVAFKDHKSELTELTDDERNAFFADVSRVAKAIHAIFHPNKINYGAFGDSSGHMHFHLVPKYKDQFEWNGVFQMNPEKTFLSDAEYAGIIQKIKAELGV